DTGLSRLAYSATCCGRPSAMPTPQQAGRSPIGRTDAPLCDERAPRRLAVHHPPDVLGDLLHRVRAEVAGDVVHLDDATGNVSSEPLAVGWRNEHVGRSVADEHRNRDLRN